MPNLKPIMGLRIFYFILLFSSSHLFCLFWLWLPICVRQSQSQESGFWGLYWAFHFFSEQVFKADAEQRVEVQVRAQIWYLRKKINWSFVYQVLFFSALFAWFIRKSDSSCFLSCTTCISSLSKFTVFPLAFPFSNVLIIAPPRIINHLSFNTDSWWYGPSYITQPDLPQIIIIRAIDINTHTHIQWWEKLFQQIR